MMDLVMTLAALLLIGQPVPPATGSDYWRSPVRCGPNCLYAYLKLHGRECDFEQISTRVAIEPAGAKMSDLRQAATELGVPSVVIKTDESGLASISLPAIVHSRNRGGHYQLLLALAPDSITTADMTSGEVSELSREQFLEGWSGYALTTDVTAHRWPAAWIAGCGGTFLLLFLVFSVRRAQSTGDQAEDH